MVLDKKTFCDLAEQDRIRLYVPMSKLNNAFGIIFFKTSSDKKKLVECIVEDYDKVLFKIKDGYKVTLRALDKDYGSENYYVCDLLSLIKEGYIKAKIKLN